MEDHATLLALCRIPRVKWHFIARESAAPGGLERLLEGHASERSSEADTSLAAIQEHWDRFPEIVEECAGTIRKAEADGQRLTTVLDSDYPVNLRLIFNLPPFLFYRGELRPEDARSVAVVGSRKVSPEGLSRARKMARLLVQADVTVLSGLARGVDTAAHEVCVEAGGRTIAVLGSGLNKVYPKENAGLAESIERNGAVVSQFFPDTAPNSYNFPRRNVVTSGMGQGTVVIEASATSGAKMQGRLALEHGKRLFLLKSLVESMPWAQKYVARGAVVVDSVEDVLAHLRAPEAIAEHARASQRSLFDEL